jgi:hypothetical protein
MFRKPVRYTSMTRLAHAGLRRLSDNARNENNFLIAVSNSSNPTIGWAGFCY